MTSAVLAFLLALPPPEVSGGQRMDVRVEALLRRTFPGGRPPLDLVYDPALKGLEGCYELFLSTGLHPRAALHYREPSGAYYGALRLAEELRSKPVRALRLREGPAFRWRGVMEGFYGRPWSWEERSSFVRWMAGRRLNLFVIAPKDDDSLRRLWRRPLSPRELEGLKSVVSAASAGFVEVAWSLSPGLDAKLSDPADVEAAVAKFESAVSAGVRKLVLSFDDTEPRAGHAAFANEVLERVLLRHPEVEMTFVPAEYWGKAAPSRYLGAIAARLDPRFRVAWTGGGIICRSIGVKEALLFKNYIRHRLVLGDNYPAQDRLLDSGRLFLGPLTGRDAGLAAYHDAYVANASALAEASKLPLWTAAAYAWDPRRYEPAKAWRKAAASLGGEAGSWLALLAQMNSASWLTGPGVPPGSKLQSLIDAYWSGDDRGSLRTFLRELERMSTALDPAGKSEPEFFRQLAPWVAETVQEARFALGALDALERRSDGKHVFPRELDKGPAVVADGALRRFLVRAAAVLTGEPPPDFRPLADRLKNYCAREPGSDILLATALDAGVAAPAVIDRAAGPRAGVLRELDPWIDALALSAGRAREALDPPLGRRHWLAPAAALAGFLHRWELRRLFLPLMASRELMEAFLSEKEAAWVERPEPPRPLSPAMWLWLNMQSRRRPDSFPTVLWAEMKACRRRPEDCARLSAAFKRMQGIVSEPPPGASPVEALPWLRKVGQYGALGLQALALEDRRQRGGTVTPRERAAWRRDREALMSGNGLEQALELENALGAFVRWSRIALRSRPKELNVELPPNPADML